MRLQAPLLGVAVPDWSALRHCFTRSRRRALCALLTYRTGPFARGGIPIANGMNDYLTC